MTDYIDELGDQVLPNQARRLLDTAPNAESWRECGPSDGGGTEIRDMGESTIIGYFYDRSDGMLAGAAAAMARTIERMVPSYMVEVRPVNSEHWANGHEGWQKTQFISQLRDHAKKEAERIKEDFSGELRTRIVQVYLLEDNDG